jgi:hypothetical protein
LAGWSVQYKSSSGNFPLTSTSNKKDLSALSIPAGGYFLLANNSFNGTTTPDLKYSSFSLSGISNGATIFLVSSTELVATDTDQSIVDKLAYGGSLNNSPETAAAPVPSSEQALFRVSDTDNNSADFVLQAASPRNLSFGQNSTTPEQTEVLEKSPDIKISEILPNPAGLDEGQEAVELINIGTSTMSLDKWFLIDSNPSSKAFQLASTSIAPGEFLVIVIPKGYFSLNNDGDTVNLLYFDQALADSVAYAGNTPEGEGWQDVSSQWMWAPETLGRANAAPPVQSGGGGSSGTSLSNNQAVSPLTVKISEFLPNPAGEGEGNEWVELYNYGDAASNLSGWKLDDSGSSAGPGSGTYELGSNFVILPKSYLVVTIPKGKFVLNNTGSDAVRLFKPDSSLLQSVSYADAPEGLSFGVDAAGLTSAGGAGKWLFSAPTPGLVNVFNIPLPEIFISELLPNPDSDEEEYVELFNASSSKINLEGFRLRIGEHEKILGKIILASRMHHAIYEDDLPAKLRNSGQTVVLLDSLERELGKVSYGEAERGQAYALSENSYFWTEKPTPGKDNEIVLAASTEEEPTQLKSATKTQSKNEVSYSKLYSETKNMSEELSQKLDNLEAMMAEFSQKAQAQEPNQNQLASAEKEKSQPQAALYLVVAFLALTVLALLVKQFFWKSSFK